MYRGIGSYLKLGGQEVVMRAAAFYSAKTWVGNCPFCPPLICVFNTIKMTLDSGIDVGQRINLGSEKFVKKRT